MEILDNAGHAVLSSYGHFLDSLLINIYNLSTSFSTVNKLSNHIEIQTMQKEHIIIYDLIDTDNKSYNKIVMVFVSICKEVEYLKYELEVEFLNRILQYGEDALAEMTNEDIYIMFADFLPQLLDILTFLRRCRQVLIHFLRQIFAAFEFSWPKDAQSIMHLKFQEVFYYLEDLLLVFVTLDTAFVYSDENKIAKHLHLFTQHLKFSPFIKDKSRVLKVLNDINYELLSGNCFQGTLNLLIEEKLFLTKSNDFRTYFNCHLRKKISEIETLKENDFVSHNCSARVAVSHVFVTKCFGMADKKIHKNVIELTKKFITIPLYGDIIWIPGIFLANNFDENCKSVNFYHQKRIDLLESNPAKDVKTYSFLVYKWTLQMENLLSVDASFSKLNGNMIQLCIEGIFLSQQIKFCVSNILQLLSKNACPMTKISVLNMCKLIELLKGVQSVFYRHNIEIGKQMNHTIQKRIMYILSKILTIKNNVFECSFKEKHMDSYLSLLLTENILYGSCSQDKILIIRLALTLINHYPLLGLNDTDIVHKLITELHVLCSLQEKVKKIVPNNLFYIEENIFPTYFKYLADSHSLSPRLQYMLQSMQNTANNLWDQQKRQFIEYKALKELYEEIEVHLRLHAHSHLKDDASLDKNNKNYNAILCATPFGIYKWLITIKGLVESYLDETFYDLTTVALHDWQSYSEMRSLAEHLFNLETLEDKLPSQTISQGLDVLEIMRNIHVFVSKYLYNLNTQCFVEYTSSNKHLNTIRIHQIANSIWTHGTGIMNTTVNFIYQFLRKKLYLCSQFLYDEHINSRLSKDLKYFGQQKLQKHSFYPYERAEKFNKGISRLKIFANGLSYLDQYRHLISQIGNALGYVRMIRSGGLHYSVAAVTYFPVLGYINILEIGARGNNFFAKANESFETTLYNALHHLNVENDSLKLLVEVFHSVFHLPENDHLRLFVMIIPPLTINFVHYIVTSKEKLSKKNSETGIFTDDGFAMGVAYLLSIFNLHNEFDSLHWFESVYEKYELDERKLLYDKEIINKENTMHDNTVKLSIKRLHMYKKEFELLQYNLNSAKVFFSGKSRSYERMKKL